MNASLDLDHGWSIGEAAFEHIVTLARRLQVRSVLEFGSGSSTIRLVLALPEATIVSVEHEVGGRARIEALARQHGLRRAPEVQERPLAFVDFGGSPILCYGGGQPWPRQIDMVIVDGPPFYALQGREGCLYHVHRYLRPGGLVVLDDAERPAERTIIMNWLAVYPGLRLLTTKGVRRLAVLEKRRHEAPRWSAPLRMRNARRLSAGYAEMAALLSVAAPGAVTGDPRLVNALLGAYLPLLSPGRASSSAPVGLARLGELLAGAYLDEVSHAALP
jgi:predicted O-methyltransferase YrrM